MFRLGAVPVATITLARLSQFTIQMSSLSRHLAYQVVGKLQNLAWNLCVTPHTGVDVVLVFSRVVLTAPLGGNLTYGEFYINLSLGSNGNVTAILPARLPLWGCFTDGVRVGVCRRSPCKSTRAPVI
jgi:hypothetical protein